MKKALFFLLITLPYVELEANGVTQEFSGDQSASFLPSDEDTLKSIVSMPKEPSVEKASSHKKSDDNLLVLPEQNEDDLAYEEQATETLTSLFEESRKLPEFLHNRSIFKNKTPDARITFLTYPRIISLVKKITALYSELYDNPNEWLYYDNDTKNYDRHIHPALGRTNNSGLPLLNATPFSFAQKITLKKGDMLINIGDLHGSYHALLHVLAKLYARKLITNELTLARDTTLIFNGDLVDRGDYSTEVCYLAYLLKLRNPKNVFILAGNHERYDINQNLGSVAEFNEKFPEKTPAKTPTIFQQLYRFLPIVLYVSVTNPHKQKPVILQYCHGGFAKSFKPMQDFLRFDQSFYYRPAGSSDSEDYSIFHWGDFSYNATHHCFSCSNRNTNETKENTKNVQYFFDDRINMGIDMIIRGHQDTLLATKIPVLPTKDFHSNNIVGSPHSYATSLINSYKKMLALSTLISHNPVYRQWVGAWHRTIDNLTVETCKKLHLHDWRDACNNKKATTFTINNMAVPVVTCSTATESKFTTEAGCLVTHTTGNRIAQWSFEPLLIDIISPRNNLFKKILRDNVNQPNEDAQHHEPARLYSITTVNQSGDATIEYSFKEPEQAFIDTTQECEQNIQ